MSVLLILDRCYRKRTKNSKNLGNFEGPRHSEGFLHRSVAERIKWPASGSPWRSYCSQRENCVFCFVLLFRPFEDLSIGLMRIL